MASKVAPLYLALYMCLDAFWKGGDIYYFAYN